jgi:hypothetical protein
MAQEQDPIDEALDRFGREVVVAARDAGIWWFDQGLARAPRPTPDTAAPDVQATIADYNALAALPPEVRQLTRRMVAQAVDNAMHELFMRLGDEARDGGATLTINGIELLTSAVNEKSWPGLHGGLFTERGWYARFSKYGERGDGPPVP